MMKKNYKLRVKSEWKTLITLLTRGDWDCED